MSLGRKINTPTIKEVTALNKTAAADKSFILLIIECFSGEIKLQIFSMAVFMISVTKTNPIQKTIRTHSNRLIFNQTPKVIAVIVSNKCIQELCSSLKKSLIPLKANLKLNKRSNMENLDCFICESFFTTKDKF